MKSTHLYYNVDGKKQNKSLTYRLICLTLILVACLSAGYGGYTSYQQWKDNQRVVGNATKLIQQANIGISHIAPSTTEVTPSEFTSYTVPATYPRYLFIPVIGVRAIVRTLGLTTDDQLATPDNVYDTGWYSGSSKPGQPGATVIDGHVSSWTTNGVFYNLKKLKTGDSLSVELGNGVIINYRVVKTIIYDSQNVDMTDVLNTSVAGTSGLNLITCSGDVIKGTNDFTQRIVVFTVKV